MSDDMFDFEIEDCRRQFEIEVLLAIAAVNPVEREKSRFLVLEHPDSLLRTPSQAMRNNQTSDNAASSLFNAIFKRDAHPWIHIEQVRFLDTLSEKRYVLYAAMIPEPMTTYKDGVRWASFNELLDLNAHVFDIRTGFPAYEAYGLASRYGKIQT